MKRTGLLEVCALDISFNPSRWHRNKHGHDRTPSTDPVRRIEKTAGNELFVNYDSWERVISDSTSLEPGSGGTASSYELDVTEIRGLMWSRQKYRAHFLWSKDERRGSQYWWRLLTSPSKTRGRNMRDVRILSSKCAEPSRPEYTSIVCYTSSWILRHDVAVSALNGAGAESQ